MPNSTKSNSTDTVVVQVMDEVARYLQRNLGAADTIDGIAKYWLPPERKVSVRLLQNALDGLLAQGLLLKNTVIGGAVIYSAARHFEDSDGDS